MSRVKKGWDWDFGGGETSREDQKPDDQEQPIAEEAKPAPKTRKKAKSTAA